MIVYNFDSKIVNTPQEIIKNAKENNLLINGNGIKKEILREIFEVDNYKLKLGDLIEHFYYQKLNKIFEWILKIYNNILINKIEKTYEIKKVLVEHKYFILNNEDIMYINLHQDNYTVIDGKVWTIIFYGEISNINGGQLVSKNRKIIPKSNMMVLLEEGEEYSMSPFMLKNIKNIGIMEIITFYFLIE